MARVRSFEPIVGHQPRILILGSMPGTASLHATQYYAHPRNAFWPIISELFDLPSGDYETRAALLARKGVAVWDVLKTCFRAGSLDSAIDDRTIVVNDLDRSRAFYRDLLGMTQVERPDFGFPGYWFQAGTTGVLNMAGNAAEWTMSRYAQYPYRDADGRNQLAGDGRRVVRGGSFFDPPQRSRSAHRLAYHPWQRVFNVGFRVVCNQPSSSAAER